MQFLANLLCWVRFLANLLCRVRFLAILLFLTLPLFTKLNLRAADCTDDLIVDEYKNFAELSSHETEGIDYSITAQKRESPSLILAIHGGEIEFGTEEIAQSIADNSHSLFIFKGLKKEKARKLHITSTNFDHPEALKLASQSKHCLSIHGFRELKSKICIGGNNERLRMKLSEVLSKSFSNIEIEDFCPGIGGQSPKNIVNRCQNEGVQLELSTGLRELLISQPETMKIFIHEIKSTWQKETQN